MGEFSKVTREPEVQPGQRKAFWVEGRRVLVFNVGGAFYAVDESCPHRECSLSKGSLKGKVIVCPCHSAQFDLETGAVITQPSKYPPTPPLPVHQVKVEDGDVMVAVSQDDVVI
ncbi:MAG: Rieske 2Fe-2S domain-containing protein [Chloroflexota bacterium]|nr:Rieske 2Fe-2S domain-containing protein [Chloroflexota bacterium]